VQTPAEKKLVGHLEKALSRPPVADAPPARVLALGAGRSLSIEDQLTERGLSFVSDRVDVEDCRIQDPRVGRCWIASIEDMPDVPDAAYDLAFANYVFEHVVSPEAAAREVFRVLRPGGLFVATIPNPRAPEFRVAALTPTWFHRWVRGENAWDTEYSYGDVDRFVALFRTAGLENLNVDRFSFIEGYLGRFPVVGQLARLYDRGAERISRDTLRGNVCAVFRKTGTA
jgi:SAM-dependent methyltransferase